MIDALFPDIDEGIPLPAKATEALPHLSPREELEMRARTIKLLAELSGNPLVPNDSDKAQASELLRQMDVNPTLKPNYDKYSNEVMAYLSECIQEAAVPLVNDLSDLKLYVVNKLVYEVEHSKSSKDRISALSKLGEIDGVNAFKKHSEMTVKVLPIEEVEKKLLSILDNIEYSVVDTSQYEIPLQNVSEGEFEETMTIDE